MRLQITSNVHRKQKKIKVEVSLQTKVELIFQFDCKPLCSWEKILNRRTNPKLYRQFVVQELYNFYCNLESDFDFYPLLAFVRLSVLKVLRKIAATL